jgi:hypothetical protein
MAQLIHTFWLMVLDMFERTVVAGGCQEVPVKEKTSVEHERQCEQSPGTSPVRPRRVPESPLGGMKFGAVSPNVESAGSAHISRTSTELSLQWQQEVGMEQQRGMKILAPASVPNWRLLMDPNPTNTCNEGAG